MLSLSGANLVQVRRCFSPKLIPPGQRVLLRASILYKRVQFLPFVHERFCAERSKLIGARLRNLSCEEPLKDCGITSNSLNLLIFNFYVLQKWREKNAFGTFSIIFYCKLLTVTLNLISYHETYIYIYSL
jgi:hypothetical protein